MGAAVTWFEITTTKPTAVRELYADLFGWKLQVLEEANYAVVDTGPEGAIGGGIGEAQGPTR
jgi:predicted enzyme related to lactoylglutathione lyase